MAARTSITTRRRFVVGFIALALLAVAAEFALDGPPWAGGRRVLWRGTSVQGHISAHFRYFDGPDGRGMSGRAGETLSVQYTLAPQQGALTLRLLAPNGRPVWSRRATGLARGTEHMELPAAGRYRIEIVGEQSRGSFDVRYRAASPAG